ncbi:transposase [Streptomyces sp. NBC_00063]|uniref:transposase n=1 Tax=Streptomyces sp. NBC_00063 TaxID=2975638 RepID=UPI002B1D19A5|nr:transposase [Streptomyces sp. NBC_00063]
MHRCARRIVAPDAWRGDPTDANWKAERDNPKTTAISSCLMRCTVPRTGASSDGRMPVGSPAWSTVYAFVSRWREQGLAQSSTTSSTEGRDRPSGVRWGRQQGSSTHSPCGWPRPSAPQLAAGDNGKKVGGPNRRISVGCLGMSLLVVLVTGANAQDSNAGIPLLEQLRQLPCKITLVWADSGHGSRHRRLRPRTRRSAESALA